MKQWIKWFLETTAWAWIGLGFVALALHGVLGWMMFGLYGLVPVVGIIAALAVYVLRMSRRLPSS